MAELIEGATRPLEAALKRVRELRALDRGHEPNIARVRFPGFDTSNRFFVFPDYPEPSVLLSPPSPK